MFRIVFLTALLIAVPFGILGALVLGVRNAERRQKRPVGPREELGYRGFKEGRR